MRINLQTSLNVRKRRIRHAYKREDVFKGSTFMRARPRSGDCLKRVKLLCSAAAALSIFALLPTLDANGQMTQPYTAPSQAESANFVRRESVLDRMRAHKGEKTRESVSALFIQTDPSFSQTPSVLLSDGTATARVTIRAPSRKGELPKFSLSGGHCISALMSDNGVWILEILPNPGSMATSVTVLSGGSMVEYPLAVAPPLNLLDPRKAEIIEIEYAVIANELAAARTIPSR